jgi:hypothetical protein
VLAEAEDALLLKYFARCLALMFADVADVSLSLGRDPLFIGAGGGQPVQGINKS